MIISFIQLSRSLHALTENICCIADYKLSDIKKAIPPDKYVDIMKVFCDQQMHTLLT
jgi:hypothetical protein